MSESDDHRRYFPYEEPYDHQRDAMGRIREALVEERDVLFEGACGTGKTLASLVPALEYAAAAGKTVLITTNVHQQTRQFIEEARAIAETEPIRAVVFRGKASMCHIDVGYEECQALRDTTRELVDKERDIAELEEREGELLEASRGGNGAAADARGTVLSELEDLETGAEAIREEETICERYYNNLTADTDAFYGWLYEDVRTPEEIYEYAHGRDLCGYELLKEGMEGVDLVVCNYHHLLDPTIREQFFRWVGRDPEDIVAVFDEAHNVADSARDHATRTLAERTIEGALDELEGVEDARAEPAANVVGAFREALVETYEDSFGFGERESIGEEWTDVAIDNETGRDDLSVGFLRNYTGQGFGADLEAALALGEELDRRYERAYKEGETTTRKECPTLTAAGFIERWMESSVEPGQYPVAGVRRAETGVVGRAELYTCLPRQVTEPLFEELHATILMSATLRPFDVTEDVLGLDDPLTMAYGEQFPESRRRTYAVETPALFASKRDDPAVQREVGDVVEDTIRFTPGNTLAFFPSYAEAERYYHRFAGESTPFLDEPGTRAEELRREFVAADDAVLFTSLWGTLAEGVSFDDDDARSVIVVGVPYPHLDDRMEAVERAYEGAFGDGDGEAGWRYAVEIPTVRKTRQALGRVVRSPEDFGVRVLVDERYTGSRRSELGEYSVYPSFPPEERSEHIDIEPGKLKFALLNFYADMDAWEGSPPEP
ncbi:DNA repair helicase Rad3 [Natronomonas moolapensis 8.8.11]|uniref:DNA repair helicase Rad3 n=1 Tax=Natronomonas moolapensis (strain DSM 18674 / CECT 7526 / JCM 14361 / 8.8.11) TaxID=268739 RepID=M1XTW6_NATM8|nr:DNA repair helicase Rad3 [Natronomonas moolapensis 8.8.11]